MGGRGGKSGKSSTATSGSPSGGRKLVRASADQALPGINYGYGTVSGPLSRKDIADEKRHTKMGAAIAARKTADAAAKVAQKKAARAAVARNSRKPRGGIFGF